MFGRVRSLTDRRVLITGASSGIGRALAAALANQQVKLLLTARREDRLRVVVDQVQTLGAGAQFLAGDITSPAHRSELIALAEESLGGLDVLVNNAGVGGIGSFESATADRLREIMEVNFFAPAELTRLAIPLLRTSHDGVLVNVGSVLGHCAVPNKSEYCASKFALHGLTDALRIELGRLGIEVLLVSPSTTQTEFFTKARRSLGDTAEAGHSMPPERVARHILQALKRRRREVILSPSGKLLVWSDRFVPGIVSRLLGKFA